ncbi:MAG: nickel pincer cofactor biosynthesis protein LarB [Phycisphaeraceae bacterium]
MSKLAGTDPIEHILTRLRDGELDIDQARRAVQDNYAESLGFATVDHDRRRRCGAAEVIFGAGKAPEHLVAIAGALLEREPCVLVTRCSAEHVAAVREAFPDEPIELAELSGALLVGRPRQLDVPPIPVVTAGTSDESVASEARMTCRALGQPALAVSDVGVAGLHRLANRLEELREANVIVCIAGMEGALPSVLSGLVDIPIVAVPTSVGYGAAMGGLTALMGMLTSCASGVSVVNIDNGFGAAYNACLINRMVSGRRGSQDDECE